MKIKSILFLLAGSILFVSCGSNSESAAKDTPPDNSTATSDSNAGGTDNSKGIGKFQNVELTHPLDQKMVDGGKAVYDLKCASCHKLSGEKLVGPGWQGVTDRRTPEWVMNFVTNTDEMITKDPAAAALLEECLVRMPNQNLTDEDARNVYEFMRKNDGVK